MATSRAAERIWVTRQVRLENIEYPYSFGLDCVDRIVNALAQTRPDRFLLVTDDAVNALHGEQFVAALQRHAPVELLSGPAGEAMKSLAYLTTCLERAIASGASRRTVVIGFGGGVPGNLAGVIAGMLFRGVRFVHVPTTTVAAMDSVISLKQAINSSCGKNHIGVYHVPEAVYIDLRLLQTLPLREMRSGLCEAAKNCLAIRPAALGALSRVLASNDLASVDALMWLIEESLRAKLAVMAQDSRERHAGLVLEYGHTVGHAVEMCDQRVRGVRGTSHGESVGFGMLVAARVSHALGHLDDAGLALHEDLIAALGAPRRLPAGVGVGDVLDVVRRDNKRGYLDVDDEHAAMVLLRAPGEPLGPADRPLIPVALDVLERVLAESVA